MRIRAPRRVNILDRGRDRARKHCGHAHSRDVIRRVGLRARAMLIETIRGNHEVERRVRRQRDRRSDLHLRSRELGRSGHAKTLRRTVGRRVWDKIEPSAVEGARVVASVGHVDGERHPLSADDFELQARSRHSVGACMRGDGESEKRDQRGVNSHGDPFGHRSPVKAWVAFHVARDDAANMGAEGGASAVSRVTLRGPPSIGAGIKRRIIVRSVATAVEVGIAEHRREFDDPRCHVGVVVPVAVRDRSRIGSALLGSDAIGICGRR